MSAKKKDATMAILITCAGAAISLGIILIYLAANVVKIENLMG